MGRPVMGGRGGSGRIRPVPGQKPATPSIDDQIRRAYGDLARRPGTLVSLARLRDELPHIPRKDLDEALLTLDRQRAIQLDPDPHRMALTDRAKAAAIPLGGEDMHLITIDLPADTAVTHLDQPGTPNS
jgi:hypothetical protein